MTTDVSFPTWLAPSDPKALYTKARRICFLDFETDNELYGNAGIESNDLVLACWQLVDTDGTTVVRHKFGSCFEMQELLDDIATCDFVVAQNAKFEARWLKRCGADLRDILFCDTMLMAWVKDGNLRLPRDLNSLARRYGIATKHDLVSTLIKKGVNPRDIPDQWLLEYCHLDVEITKQVFYAMLPDLEGLWHLVHTRNLTCAALADIEFEGLFLDPERVRAEYYRALGVQEGLGVKLAEMTGGINLGSPVQLSAFLYDTLGFDEPKDHRGKPIRTDTGQRTANAKALEKLKATTEEQKAFLSLYKEYNKASSLLEKSLTYFHLACQQRDGHIFGSFNQGVVQTHRLSSSGLPIRFEGEKQERKLQFQNVPREYKQLFWSGDDDYLVGEADGAQLEFRVAADLGRDEVAMQEIADGVDVHSISAQTLTEAGEPTTRQEAKAVTFRPLFGGKSGSPALMAYCEFFQQKYDGISTTQRDWAMEAFSTKKQVTPYGLIYYWPNITMDKRTGYISNTTNIYNYPISISGLTEQSVLNNSVNSGEVSSR